MKVLRQEESFKKDLKAIKKRKYPIDKMEIILSLLIKGDSLPGKYKDHALIGNWKNYRECHIRPNWLLIYRESETEIILVATGTHDELFK